MGKLPDGFVAAAGEAPAILPPTVSELPETISVPSGSRRLKGFLWTPSGAGRSPAVLFCHGSGPTDPAVARVLGPVFLRHGYAFLYLFRRGDGLSADQGPFMGDLLDRESAANGSEARSRLQMRLLETDHLDDVIAGLSFLRGLPRVDGGHVAVAGHSFGGQLAILAAERDSSLRASVAFAPASFSWDKSSALRDRLLTAVRQSRVPLLLVFAANDFSTAPGKAMGAAIARAGRAGGVEFYPAVGKTADEGHAAVYRAITVWEKDVFEFLDRYVRG